MAGHVDRVHRRPLDSVSPRGEGTMQAQAATYQSESLPFSTLLQLAVIVVVARLANVGLRRLRQPGAVGEMLAGLLLGPSLLGYLLPNVSEYLFAKAADIPV